MNLENCPLLKYVSEALNFHPLDVCYFRDLVNGHKKLIDTALKTARYFVLHPFNFCKKCLITVFLATEAKKPLRGLQQFLAAISLDRLSTTSSNNPYFQSENRNENRDLLFAGEDSRSTDASFGGYD